MIPKLDFPRPDIVDLHLAARSASDALSALAAGLSQTDGIADHPRFLRELLARHALGSNCLDQQITLPHVRTLAVNRIVVAAARVDTGIAFDAEHPAIRLIFLIGVPAAATGEYLRVVSQLVRTLRQAAVRKSLLEAPDAESFASLLQGG